MFLFKLIIEIKPPFLTQQSGVLAFGLDAKSLVNKDGALQIPSSLIKGHIQEEMAHLDEANLAQKWFGKADSDGSNAQIVFEQLLTQQEQDKLTDNYQQHTRTKPNDQDGNLQQGAVRVSAIAATEQADQTIKFTCQLCIHQPTEDGAVKTAADLNKRLSLIAAMGSNKGIGFGQLLTSQVELSESFKNESNPHVTKLNEDSRTLTIKVTPLWPFCFQRLQADQNAIMTHEHIPGSAIKAGIAQRLKGKLNADEQLQKLFDATTFNNARPSLYNNIHSSVIPNSLAKLSGTPELKNLANLSSQACKNISSAIAFPIDYKPQDWQVARDECGQPSQLTITRMMRHAHDHTTRAAKNEQLFSIETINPTQHSGLSWLGRIHFPNTAPSTDIKHFINAVRDDDLLGAGYLAKLGKTHTPAHFELIPEKPQKSYSYYNIDQPNEKQQGLILTLQSAAWLLKLEEVTDLNLHDTQSLISLYQSAFNDLLHKTDETELAQQKEELFLENIFTHEILNRPNRWWENETTYKPVVLTEAGSVFVFRCSRECHEKHRATLAQWKHMGLPQRTDHSNDYKKNRYLRESGYGEITLDRRWT